MKKLLHLLALAAIALLWCVSEANAQVVADNNPVTFADGTNSSSTFSIPFTVPANNKALLVIAFRNTDSRTVTSITYNGSTLTELGSTSVGDPGIAVVGRIYFLALGNVGVPISSNIVIALNGTPVFFFCHCRELPQC